MKKLNKIIGVILTLAILAGSLVMAVPVTAGTDVWTTIASFPVTAGTDTYIYTIAADGTTMYMWTPVKTNVTASSTGTTGTTLKVSNTVGFGPGPILIGTVAATISAVTSSTTSITLTAPVAAPAGAQVAATGTAVAGAVYKSTDAGLTWTATGLNTPRIVDYTYGSVANIRGIKVCPTDPNNLVAWDSYIPAVGSTPAVPASIYRSTDGSKVWTRLAGADNITGAGTTSIYSVDIVDNGGIQILVGTNKGVGCFMSNDAVWKSTINSSSTPSNVNTPVNLFGYSAKTTYTGASGSKVSVASTAGFNPGASILVDSEIATLNSIENSTSLVIASPLTGSHSASTSLVTQSFSTPTYAVAFAPNYDTSREILGVTIDNSTGVLGTYLRTYVRNDATWDYQVQKAALKKSNTVDITAITGASLAFPSDYDFASSSTNKVYVGLDNSTVSAAGVATADPSGFGDLYRVNGSTVSNSATAPKVYDLGVDSGVMSVACSGTAASATLIVGLTVPALAFNGVPCAVVKTSTDADTVTLDIATWIESTKNPYGTLGQANVQLDSKGSLYVGTRGDCTAFFKANEATFNSFNGISMFDINNLYTVSIGGQVGFEATTGTISTGSVVATMQFQTSTAGNRELILESPRAIVAGGGGGSGPSPVYNAGGVILLEQTQSKVLYKYLYKSTDGGKSWSHAELPVEPGQTITAVLLVNGDTWWVAWNGYIAASAGIRIAVPGTPTEITSVDSTTNPMNIALKTLVGTTSSTVTSSDGGKTWKIVTSTGSFTGTTLLAPKLVGDVYWLVDNYWNIWHETSAGTNIYEKTRLGVGMPIEMKQGADDTVLMAPTLGFNVVSGVYFMVTQMNHNGQLWRNTGDTGSDWRPVPGTEYTAAGMKGSFGNGLKVTALSVGGTSAKAPAGGGGAAKAPAAGGSSAPSITSITPNTGPIAGGTVVTIGGVKLGGGIGTVTFGGVAATGITQVGNPPSYVCTTPPHDAGGVDVVLTNGGGTATSAGGFTYGSGGPVSAILPGSGWTAGGTALTLTPINFISGTAAQALVPAASSGTGFEYTGDLVLNLAWSAPADGKGTTQSMDYIDTAIIAPVPQSPAPDAVVSSPVDFTFTSQYSNADAGYQVQIARDADFETIVDSITSVGQGLVGIDLDPSDTYYWRVRMNGALGDGRGLMSMWSVANSFSVKSVNGVANSIDKSQYVFPARSQTGVSLDPVMTWGIVNNANYNTQLATDYGFTSIVDSAKDLSVALWQPAKTLEPNKKYYWRVQAVNSGISSDWVVFYFTAGCLPGTAAALPAAGTGGPVSTIAMPTNPVINVPTAQVNLNGSGGAAQNAGTPPYVWVVIVIGAILVVAVLVLIIRGNSSK